MFIAEPHTKVARRVVNSIAKIVQLFGLAKCYFDMVAERVNRPNGANERLLNDSVITRESLVNHS